MFTIESVKSTFGDKGKDYYVYCKKCPLDGDPDSNCPVNCTGYADTWEAIGQYLAETADNDETDVADDSVNHPSHYNRGTIEVADFIADQQLNFNRGNAIKYICRAGFKSDEVEDLEKAIWYLNHELKMCNRQRKLQEDVRDVVEKPTIPTTNHVRGEQHHSSKLTEDDVLFIKSCHGKVPQKVLCEKFGVSQGTISSIQCGRLWSHVKSNG